MVIPTKLSKLIRISHRGHDDRAGLWIRKELSEGAEYVLGTGQIRFTVQHGQEEGHSRVADDQEKEGSHQGSNVG